MTNRSGTFNVGFYTTRQDVEEKHNMIGLHVNVTKFQILLTTLYKKIPKSRWLDTPILLYYFDGSIKNFYQNRFFIDPSNKMLVCPGTIK